MKAFSTSFLLGVAVLAFSQEGHSATISIPITDDVFLNGRNPDNNTGGSDLMSSGTDGTGNDRRGLLRFSLASIPAGATIMSASLDLSVVRTPNFGSVDSSFSLHFVSAFWGIEGTGTGNNGQPAVNGDVTWNNRVQGSDAWTTPGGLAGTDYVASASSTTPVTGLGAYTWTGLQSDVQAWLDAPATNNGWMLISASEGTNRTARAFGTAEGGMGAILRVDYIPEPSSAVMALAGLVFFARRRSRK